MGLRRLLKKATRVEVIHLEPGDVFHIHFDEELTAEDIERMKMILAKCGFSDPRALVTCGEVTIEIIRQEVAA